MVPLQTLGYLITPKLGKLNSIFPLHWRFIYSWGRRALHLLLFLQQQHLLENLQPAPSKRNRTPGTFSSPIQFLDLFQIDLEPHIGWITFIFWCHQCIGVLYIFRQRSWNQMLFQAKKEKKKPSTGLSVVWETPRKQRGLIQEPNPGTTTASCSCRGREWETAEPVKKPTQKAILRQSRIHPEDSTEAHLLHKSTSEGHAELL